MLSLTLRTLILYAIVIFAVRLMGKKQISELQPSELVTTIIISNIVTISLEETNVPLIAGVVPILLIVSLDVIITGVNLKSLKARKLLTGTPGVIISNGVIDQAAMKRMRYTIDDLLEAARESSIFDLNDVQFAIVENTGKISFCEKTAAGNPPTDPRCVIIKDGDLDKDGFARSGWDESKLRTLLNENKAAVKDVFLLTGDCNGEYNLVLKS